FASQPSPSIMLQSSNPGLHWMPQLPALHDATPFCDEQTRPHMPQFITSVPVFRSHPSAALLLQLAKPALHAAMVQVPLMQAPVALAGAHAALHAPQCARLLPRAVSQPFA